MPAKPDVSGSPPAAAASLPPPEGVAEVARVVAARRVFLLRSALWQGEKAVRVMQAADHIASIRHQWAAWMLGYGSGDVTLPGKIAAARVEVDGLLEDHLALTEEAKKQLDEWEHKGWRGMKTEPAGFHLDLLDATWSDVRNGVRERILPKGVYPSGAQRAAMADFQARRDVVISPLLDQLEYLEPADRAVTTDVFFKRTAPQSPEELDARTATTPERRHADELAARRQGELDSYMAAWRSLQERWQEHLWEGYAERSAASPGTLPGPPEEGE